MWAIMDEDLIKFVVRCGSLYLVALFDGIEGTSHLFVQELLNMTEIINSAVIQ